MKAHAGTKADAVEAEAEPAKKLARRLWVHADLKSSPGGLTVIEAITLSAHA